MKNTTFGAFGQIKWQSISDLGWKVCLQIASINFSVLHLLFVKHVGKHCFPQEFSIAKVLCSPRVRGKKKSYS